MNSNIQVIEQLFGAINRNDIEAAASAFDPDIVRIEPESFPMAGTYRGIAEVSAHLAAGRGTWAEGSCDPEGFFAREDKVVVYLHARVRMKNATEWMGGRFADGFTLRAGKILEYRSFGTRDEALRWAGIANTI